VRPHVQCLNIGFSRGINHGENVPDAVRSLRDRRSRSDRFMCFIYKTHEEVQ